MKRFQFALILALLLPLAGNTMADSRPSKQSSSSFKSGFSSQRSTPARDRSASRPPSRGNSSFGSFSSRPSDAAPPPSAPSSRDDATRSRGSPGGFGSFGSGAGATSDNATGRPAGRSSSAMSQDLEQNRASSNAVRTLDERRAADTALPPLNNRVPGVDQPYAQQQPRQGYGQPQYGPSQPYSQQPPVIVQQGGGGGGFGGALMGFMLGRAMSGGGGQHGGYYPQNGAQNGGYNNGVQGGVSQARPAQVEQPSFFTSVLRIFAWLVLLSLIGWLVYFGVKAMRRGKARRTANYSFDRE